MTKADFGIFLENYDKRGSIFRGDYNKKEIFLITEIKKGETRGGHYHTTIVNHHVLRGKIIYKEIRLTKKGNIKKNYKETKKIICFSHMIFQNTVDLTFVDFFKLYLGIGLCTDVIFTIFSMFLNEKI